MLTNFLLLRLCLCCPVVWRSYCYLAATYLRKVTVCLFCFDFNPFRKISLWFPLTADLLTNLSSHVWLSPVTVECGSWATGGLSLEVLQLCDGLFLQLLPSDSVKVWVCHHSCTWICSLSCLHSNRHKGNFLQVISSSHEYMKNTFTSFHSYDLLFS